MSATLVKKGGSDPSGRDEETASGRRRSTREGKKTVKFSPTKEVCTPLLGLCLHCSVRQALRTLRDPPRFSIFYCRPTRLSRCSMHESYLGKRSPTSFASVWQVEQHSRRYRKTNQEVLDDYVSGYKEVKRAWMDVEVAEVMDDIVYAIVDSIGGTHECEMCAYENKRDLFELTLWEQENSGTIDRWLQLKGCHLFKTVSVGGCGHLSMPWQVEERKKRAV